MTILTVVNTGDLILCNVITTFMTFATLDQISLKVGVNKAREFRFYFIHILIIKKIQFYNINS